MNESNQIEKILSIKNIPDRRLIETEKFYLFDVGVAINSWGGCQAISFYSYDFLRSHNPLKIYRLCYNNHMKKTLIETNPYLQDPVQRKELIARSVRTSCGVEGIEPKKDNVHLVEIKHRVHKRIYDTIK